MNYIFCKHEIETDISNIHSGRFIEGCEPDVEFITFISISVFLCKFVKMGFNFYGINYGV